MRIFEGILMVVLLAGGVGLAKGLSARWTKVLALLAVSAAMWHAVREGTHWQMFPAWLGLLLLVGWLVAADLRRPFSGRVRKAVAYSLLLLVFASFGLSILFPMFTLPKPTGPYAVGTRIVYLEDAGRHEAGSSDPASRRELMVQIWYPAERSQGHLAAYQRREETSLATSYRSVLWTNSRVDAPVAAQGAPFTVLLFNHAWGLRRTQDTFLTEELASHGYVVAAIDHTYNAGRVALPGDRVIDGPGYDPINVDIHTAAQILQTWNKELVRWVADESFVLDTLQAANLDARSPWYGRLETQRAGAVGHSFGGAASIEAASVDPRIRSAVNMDGWTFGDILERASDRPVMYLYAETSQPQPEPLNSPDRAERTEAELDDGDMAAVDARLRRSGGYRLYVRNSTHMDFTDHSMVSPWRNWTEPGHIAPAEIQGIVRAYVLAFFDQTLRGKESPLLQSSGASPFPEVRFESWAAAPQAAGSMMPDGVHRAK